MDITELPLPGMRTAFAQGHSGPDRTGQAGHRAPLPPCHVSLNMGAHSSPRTGHRMADARTPDDPQDASGLGDLLVDVAAGSRNAFETLYRATSSRLFAICLRTLSDRAEAEDVLQEVYTTVWHKAHQFDPGRASPVAWLAMIACNRAIDRLRAQPARGAMTAIEVAEELPDTGATPLQTAVAADDRARLDACMRQLDARRQSLIRAAFFDGATYEELAQRIASPLGSVKSWIRRGLLQLRECLGA